MFKSKVLKTAMALLVIASFVPTAHLSASESKREKTFSINFENTELRSALELLAQHSGLRLNAPSDLPGTINYSFANVTLESALKQIARENGLTYKIGGGALIIGKGYAFSGGNDRSPASVDGAVNTSGARHIKLRYLTADNAADLISGLLGKDDRIIKDAPSNSLIFFGSDTAYAVVSETLGTFDLMPQQILIEAHIVELNKNKSREFGFSYGDLGDPTLADVQGDSAVITNPGPSRANLAVQLGLGGIDGSVLSARLAAAETDGSAKILSRPKVVTINNKPAVVTSGISYNIRTLAAIGGTTGGSGSGSGTSTATSGVTQVNAGLNLSVTPTIVGEDKVKLLISVNNSEPDETTLVDGIPGIISNTTNTEIIVADGKTASVAGLVKNTFAESETGVPWLAKVPVLGWLFSSKAKSNRDKELMVFITPKIVDRNLKLMDQGLGSVEKQFPEIYEKEKKKAAEEAKEDNRTPAGQ